MEVLLVTSNPGKFEEAREILRPYGLSLRRGRQHLPELQADSLEEVVRGKLAAVAREQRPVVVEDSGLFIPALGGFPGVYSAYIYRIWGFDPILELLRHRDRSASFRTVVGVRLNGRLRTFSGEVVGTIARRSSGQRGFGFDPIFVPAGGRRTFAQLLPEEKNQVSHRGRAFRRLGKYLAGPGGRARRVRPG